MVAHSDKLQRIARLTPLGEALPLIEALARPVGVQQVDLPGAFGLTLAKDAFADAARPPAALALRDGWAVASGDILDAAATAPVPLPQPPAWLETGDPLPPGTDAVAPFDVIAWHGGTAEAATPVAPGEGVLAAGADASAGAVLRPAGARLRHSDLAVLAAAGVERVSVRVPRIRVVYARAAHPISNAAGAFVARVIAAQGGAVLQQTGTAAGDLDQAFRDAAADAVIGIGGTGMGRRDAAVRTLARSGRVAVHGIAICPGETAALGEVDGKPVLLLPGRIDAALAAWLLLGRPLLARLRGGSEATDGTECDLVRKVSSNLGLTEVIPVRRAGNGVEPLASGYLSLVVLASADGWILVPPDSEGYPAGHRVTVRPLP